MKKSLIVVCLYALALCIGTACSSKNKAPEAEQPAPTAETQGEKPDSQAAETQGEKPDETAAKNAAPQPQAEKVAAKPYDPTPAPRISRSDECPKGAFMAGKDTLKDENLWRCSCFYGGENASDGKGSYGVLRRDGSDVVGAQFECASAQYDNHEFVQAAVCAKPGGCKTLDGKWYALFDIAAASLYVDEADEQEYAKTKDITFDISKSEYEDIPYITGGMDTSLKSGAHGNCVLDRTDGIPRFSDVPNATDNFACNIQTCSCGSTQCVNGQLCKGGACEWDPQDGIAVDKANPDFLDEEEMDDFRKYLSEQEKYKQILEKCLKTNAPQICITKKSEDGDWDVTFIRKVDTRMCKGGHHYCHGRGNFPIAKPEKSRYLCQPADIFEQEDSKAWLCDSQECDCGTGKCPMHAACIEGQCYCGAKAYAEGRVMPAGYRCSYKLDPKPHTAMECAQETCK